MKKSHIFVVRAVYQSKDSLDSEKENRKKNFLLLHSGSYLQKRLDKCLNKVNIALDNSVAFNRILHKSLAAKIESVGLVDTSLMWLYFISTNKLSAFYTTEKKSSERLIKVCLLHDSVHGPCYGASTSTISYNCFYKKEGMSTTAHLASLKETTQG